ncbi:MAG TPA: LTA synthase family protein [Microvirga sp.]|jgi:hypothetical protein|nr:LTA synthase family protein [Microvirga sp.]
MVFALLVLAFCLPAGMALERAVRTGGAPADPLRGREGIAAAIPAGIGLAIRFAAHLCLLLACFGLAWRPVLAGAAYLGIVGGLAAASRIKHRIMRENVVFSDLLLVRTIIRHPRLYYVSFSDPRVVLAVAGLGAAAVAWLVLEPSLLVSGARAFVLAPLPLLAGLAGLWGTAFAGARPVARAALLRDNPTVAIDAAIDAVGLLASLLTLWGEWIRMERPPEAVRAHAQPDDGRPAPGAGAGLAPLVIAIQCESFINPAGRGLAAPGLAAFEAASATAVHAGRLHVPAFAANTMRAEFAFLSGLPNRALGCDRFNPYLTAPAYADVVWPARLRAAGWRTVFAHPYDRRFFERDRVVPALGFEATRWQEDFADAARRGHYVADVEVARLLLREAEAARGPTFVFAVTMENHGPWGAGRLPGLDRPVDQYLHHLQGSDAMVAALMAGLRHRAGPTLLCLYGDHVPALSGLGPEAEAGLTDFVIVDPTGRTPPGVSRDPRRVEDLLSLCLAALPEPTAMPRARAPAR